MITQETAIVETGEREVTTTKPGRPMLTDQAISAITYDLKMAERLVTESLEEMIDYGQLPGVPGKGLWDPGASKIMNAFQTYPRHKVLYHEETDQLITWAIEAEIIHRESSQIVGAGVGACSTREPKYKYRWVEKAEAKRLGYSDPEIENLKKKKGKRWTDDKKVYEVDEFRVENPEYGEQVNTILQMASKRAETDAAKTLPGVAGALRKLFDAGKSQRAPNKGKAKEDIPGEDSPRWTSFWNAIRDILGEGYQEKIREICKVKKMEDWLAKGKSLDDAIKLASEWKKQHPDRRSPSTYKPTDIKTPEDLVNAMNACFGWEESRIWSEANYNSRKNFEEAGVEKPWDIFAKLSAIAAEMEKAPEEG